MVMAGSRCRSRRRARGRDRRLRQGKPDATAAGGADESNHGHRSCRRNPAAATACRSLAARPKARNATPATTGLFVEFEIGRQELPRKADWCPEPLDDEVSFDGPHVVPVAREPGVAAKSPGTPEQQVSKKRVRLPARRHLHGRRFEHVGGPRSDDRAGEARFASGRRQPGGGAVMVPEVGAAPPVAAGVGCRQRREMLAQVVNPASLQHRTRARAGSGDPEYGPLPPSEIGDRPGNLARGQRWRPPPGALRSLPAL